MFNRSGWKLSGPQLWLFEPTRTSKVPGHDIAGSRLIVNQRLEEFLTGGLIMARRLGITLEVKRLTPEQWTAKGQATKSDGSQYEVEARGSFNTTTAVGSIEQVEAWKVIDRNARAEYTLIVSRGTAPSWRPGLVMASELEFLYPADNVHSRFSVQPFVAMSSREVRPLITPPTVGAPDPAHGMVRPDSVETYTDDGQNTVQGKSAARDDANASSTEEDVTSSQTKQFRRSGWIILATSIFVVLGVFLRHTIRVRT
jgi:hypothetical protein